MQDFDVYLNELYEVLRNMCAIHVVRPISWRLVEGIIEQAYHMCQIIYGLLEKLQAVEAQLGVAVSGVYNAAQLDNHGAPLIPAAYV